jgi:hypothetical protein
MVGWLVVEALASPAASPGVQPAGAIARRAAATTVLMLIIYIKWYYTPFSGIFKPGKYNFLFAWSGFGA